MDFPIKTASDLEKISPAVKWQYFEKLVEFIFAENGFATKQCVIIKDGPVKRQFDVVATRYGKTFLIECKKWKSRREYNSAIKTAVKKHMERCTLYEDVRGPGMPVIVTLVEGEIEEHDGVPIVPIAKLNWFINNYEYKDDVTFS
jgi:hypothetical protein